LNIFVISGQEIMGGFLKNVDFTRDKKESHSQFVPLSENLEQSLECAVPERAALTEVLTY
jgi:hypothetical protein